MCWCKCTNKNNKDEDAGLNNSLNHDTISLKVILLFTDDQAKSSRPGSVDLKVVLQAMKANPVSRVSGKLSISQPSVVCHLHDLGKSIQSC